jgi:hypothetical protein
MACRVSPDIGVESIKERTLNDFGEWITDFIHCFTRDVSYQWSQQRLYEEIFPQQNFLQINPHVNVNTYAQTVSPTLQSKGIPSNDTNFDNWKMC